MNKMVYLLKHPLPRWSQMVVTGTKITENQALEIIRRTDVFFTRLCGNNEAFMNAALKAVDHPGYGPPTMEASRHGESEKTYFVKRQRWENNWGLIDLNYVENDWLSSCYVGGPHGWCHPDGTIGYIDNIGTYPAADLVFDDWKAIAKHFPFLELEITLMDGEATDEDRKPVISYLVRNGTVQVVDPLDRNLHAEFNRTILKPLTDEMWFRRARAFIETNGSDENALPISQFHEWATAHNNSESETE